MILISGLRCFMTRIASVPLMIGIERSNSTSSRLELPDFFNGVLTILCFSDDFEVRCA